MLIQMQIVLALEAIQTQAITTKKLGRKPNWLPFLVVDSAISYT